MFYDAMWLVQVWPSSWQYPLQKDILHIRRGIRTGEQAQLVRQVERLGANVTVTQLNVIYASEALTMLQEAEGLAPVAAVFHLAMYLDDRMLANQVGHSNSVFTHLYGKQDSVNGRKVIVWQSFIPSALAVFVHHVSNL